MNNATIKPLVIPTNLGKTFFDYTDIVRLEAGRKKILIYNKKGEILTSAISLSDIREILPEEIFFKSHRSHIVNLACISNYNSKTGKLKVDGTEVPISRNSRQKLTAILTTRDDVKYIHKKPSEKK